jgi:hypothetical protein
MRPSAAGEQQENTQQKGNFAMMMSLPPGFSTRRTSCRSATRSGQKKWVSTAVTRSNRCSQNGKHDTDPWRMSTGDAHTLLGEIEAGELVNRPSSPAAHIENRVVLLYREML